jgi:hypothetical protein
MILFAALIMFNYMSVIQEEEFEETNHYEKVGESLGQGVKIIKETPGKIIESNQYQDLKEGFNKQYQDTTQ